MKLKNEEEFSNYIKEKRPEGVCLFYGAEPYLIELWRNHMLNLFGGEEGFNLHKLDGEKPDLNLLYDATQALPLFANETCVLLNNLDISKFSAEDIEKLCSIFVECPAECMLLVTTAPDRFDPKSAGGKKIIVAAEKSGCVAEFAVRTESGLVEFLQKQADKAGCTISALLARELLRMAGGDMMILSREIEKLCAYAGGGSLTREQMDAIITPKTDAKVFDLSRAITAGNGQRAMELVRDLFSLRESPVAILATLAMAYVDLYRARVARDQGISAAQTVSVFGYKGREFRVNNAYQSRLSAKSLRKSLNILSDCDLRMKSTGTDARLLLEQAVAGLLAVREC